jgi:hypothetical protein
MTKNNNFLAKNEKTSPFSVLICDMNITPRNSLLAAFTLIAVALPSLGQAQTLTYEGTYSEKNKPVTGNRSMEVRLYTTSTGGNVVARETISSVQITKGKFKFKYGNNGIADKLSGTSNWIALAVQGVEQKTRLQLATVPFALHSGDTQALKAKIATLELQIGYLKSTAEALIWEKYQAFIGKNPNWITDNTPDSSAQVETPSQYTGIVFPDAGAAYVFDLWFEMNYTGPSVDF